VIFHAFALVAGMNQRHFLGAACIGIIGLIMALSGVGIHLLPWWIRAISQPPR